MRRVTWLAVPALLSACGLGGPCDHARGITLYASFNGVSVAGVDPSVPLSQVAFWERQQDSRREASWSILSTPLLGTATQVDLLQGSPDAGGGTLLYSFPIQNARLVRDSLLQVTTGTSAYGADSAAFLELVQQLYQHPTYLEVKTDSVPSGAFRSRLGSPPFLPPPDDPSVWKAIYCG